MIDDDTSFKMRCKLHTSPAYGARIDARHRECPDAIFLMSTWILSAYADEVEPHILFVKPYLFSLPIPNPSLSNFIDYCSCYLWFGELCFDQTKAIVIPLSLVIVLINQIDFLLLPYWYLMEFRWFLGNCVCAREGLWKRFHCIYIVVFLE